MSYFPKIHILQNFHSFSYTPLILSFFCSFLCVHFYIHSFISFGQATIAIQVHKIPNKDPNRALDQKIADWAETLLINTFLCNLARFSLSLSYGSSNSLCFRKLSLLIFSYADF